MVLVTFLFFLLFSSSQVQAKDLGTIGVISPIVEQDPIQLIQQKLKTMEDLGELKQHQHALAKKAKDAVERPLPVEGITRATKSRLFTYDPTYEVKKDIKDHRGQILYSKGTRVNPLETVNLSQSLLFFDGDDEEQVAFVKEKIEEAFLVRASLRLILVRGAPLVLSEEFQRPVYFDQGGFLTKKLGIKHVPAIVSQSSLSSEETKKSFYLQIEEVFLSCSSLEKRGAHKGGEDDPL